MNEKKYDLVVVGGGMVGAATALGAAKIGYKVAILEKNALPTFDASQDYDIRISAISVGSVALLTQLNAWQHTESMRAHSYTRLETWEEEQSKILFDAQDLNFTNLGYMVENNAVQLGLWEEIKKQENLDYFLECQLQSAIKTASGWQFTLADAILDADLVVAADGANSHMRDLAEIDLFTYSYKQKCMLINVELDDLAGTSTWQEFHTSGPRALLPLAGNKACLVWYDAKDKIDILMQMNDKDLAEEIMLAFPLRLGKVVDVKNKAAFELIRRHAKQYVKNGVVLLGDAAHTINPLAGQGVNLGFKDVKGFLANLEEAKKQGLTLNSPATMKGFEFKRMPDNWLMQTGMDVFYHAFNNDFLPLKALRNFGFRLGNNMDFTKKQVLKYALGL